MRLHEIEGRQKAKLARLQQINKAGKMTAFEKPSAFTSLLKAIKNVNTNDVTTYSSEEILAVHYIGTKEKPGDIGYTQYHNWCHGTIYTNERILVSDASTSEEIINKFNKIKVDL